MMRVIIAGGRDYRLTVGDYAMLNQMRGELPITSVVCGMARGADMSGRTWARISNLPVDEHPAKWDEHGRSAGPIRNREMAEVADALIAFPGGRGTNDMIDVAKKKGLKVVLAGIKEAE